MKRFRMPTAYTILFFLLIAVAAATWFVPAGQYAREGEDQTPVAGTYAQVEQQPQGVAEVVLAPFRGFYDAVDVAVFILMVGGFLGVMMKTGAIDAGIAGIIAKLHGKERLLIPILMIFFGLGGTSFGMWEETMAFFPLLIPVFVAAGYDAVTAVAVILLGAGSGVMAGTVNPFATGIASGFAGVSLGDGILLRLLLLLLYEGASIWFVMAYAAKIKKRPELSRVAGRDQKFRHEGEAPPLTTRRKIALGIAIGLIYGLGEEETADAFVSGGADLIGVAFIIGISRGVTVLMNDGAITDTVLHWGEEALSGAGGGLFAVLVFLLCLPLSILIPSSSALAVLAIPILAPLGQFAGVEKSLVVTAFQAASGLVNIITPTAAVVMGGLAFGRVPYDRWFRFVWKLLLIFVLLTAGILWGSAIL